MDGYLLPENLPVRARETIIDGSLIKRRFNEIPNALYISVNIGYMWAGYAGQHFSMRGSLYCTPIMGNSLGMYRKYDLSFWSYVNSNITWVNVVSTVTEDTSYRLKTNSSVDYSADEWNPTISIYSYTGGTKNNYLHIRFNKTNGVVPLYNAMQFILKPDFFITTSNNNIGWTHIRENNYN